VEISHHERRRVTLPLEFTAERDHDDLEAAKEA
jgi:hypothetical protein